jgi:hypothetical protein
MATLSKIATVRAFISFASAVQGQHDGVGIRDNQSRKFKDPAEVLSIPLKKVEKPMSTNLSTAVQWRYLSTDVLGVVGAAYLAEPMVSIHALLHVSARRLIASFSSHYRKREYGTKGSGAPRHWLL